MKLLQYIKENRLTHKEVIDILEQHKNGKPYIPEVRPKPILIEDEHIKVPETTDDNYWNVPEPPTTIKAKTPKQLLSEFDIIDFTDGFYTFRDGNKNKRLFIYSNKVYIDSYTEGYHKNIQNRNKRDFRG